VADERQQEEFQAMSPELPEAEVEAPRGKGIGTATLRKEDPELITGAGRFVDDIKLPGMLHLAFVRSTVAHGKLGSVDAQAALQVPGVRAVYTADDLDFAAGVPCGSNPTGDAKQPPRWPLARGTVRMVGEPIAVVVAEDRYAAADGAAAVEVDITPLPVVTNAEEARRDGAPQLHDEAPGNLCCTIAHTTDGFDAAVSGAAVTVQQRIVNQRLTPVAIEPRGVVAQFLPVNGEVTLYTSTQVPHFV
jgi:carbon-monoxide dehydrogenase large subunit